MTDKGYGALAEDVPAVSGNPAGDTEAPPTYTDSGNSPPTYDSLYGQLKDARDKSSGSTDFLKTVCRIIFGTIGFTIFICIMLVIPVSMIVIGAINLNNCEMERFIPIWLVVAGSVSAFMQLCSICMKLKARCEGREEEDSSSIVNGFNGLLGCFNIAWFFAGNVWVFRHYAAYSKGDASCDPVTYYFAFCSIVVAYALCALVCCCSCCIAMCGRK